MNELTSTTAKFYRHSGKAPVLGLLLIGLAGFVAIPILGLIYGYLLRYIPFIYINCLIVLGYAYAISFVITRVAKYGKVRNIILIGLAGLFFGFLADYIGWVSWIAAMTGDPTYLIGFFFPFEVFGLITEIAKEGAWTLSGATPTGAALYFIWFVEACIVIGGSTYLSIRALSEIPFCEDSDTWADKKTILGAFTPVANAQQFKTAVAQGSFAPFNELKPAQAGSRHFTLLETYECEQCKSFFVLNVKNVDVKIDRKGKAETKTKPIISNLIVTPTTLASLRKLAEVRPPDAITP
jgi:hypothetical protein